MKEKDAMVKLISSLEEEAQRAKKKRGGLFLVLLLLGMFAPLDLPFTHLGLVLFTMLLYATHSHLGDIESLIEIAKDTIENEKI